MKEDLRHDHDFPARDVVFLEESTKDAFGLAVGIRVCDVEGVDSTVVGVLHYWEGFFEGDDPWLPAGVAVGHAS